MGLWGINIGEGRERRRTREIADQKHKSKVKGQTTSFPALKERTVISWLGFRFMFLKFDIGKRERRQKRRLSNYSNTRSPDKPPSSTPIGKYMIEYRRYGKLRTNPDPLISPHVIAVLARINSI
jgi:hypothetical protein